MSWASKHIEELSRGNSVHFRPRGRSMTGRIEDGQLVEVKPVDKSTLTVDDIVLCKVQGHQYLHLIKEIRETSGKRSFLIGNNVGRINGWVNDDSIFGIVTSIDR